MFNNMKNKIREKTGNDIPKFIANYNKIKSHHSRQSSISSMSSVTSEQSLKEDANSKVNPPVDTVESQLNLENNKNVNLNITDVGDKIINDLTNWEMKYYEKEQEWNKKEKIYVEDLLKQTKELQNALLLVEESQRKYKHCQEEKDQLESYQKQELIKIKQLLLEKEEENNSIKLSLKEYLTTIETLKQEISRLRIFEDQVNTCQIDQNKDEKLNEYDKKYVKLADDYKELKERLAQLEQTHKDAEDTHEILLSNEHEKNIELNIEVNQLRDRVQQLMNNFQEERNVKEQTIFRNAQISQQAQLTDQELQRQQIQNEELSSRVSQLEEMLEQSQKMITEQLHQGEQSSISSVEIELGGKLKEMEVEISDKNKSIKMLQQKLVDMKKTLQEELKSNTDNSTRSNTADKPSPDDINFKYLKHVLVKFLTSSDCEAQHLTRVVASLLQLNADEEKLLRETLEWRMSWFGMRPKLKHRLHYS